MIKYALPLVAALALTACEETVSAAGAEADTAGFTKITSAAEFNRQVVGKLMAAVENPSDTNLISADGTFSGEFRNEMLRGTWIWDDGAWCRTLLTHNQSTDCQIIELNGNQMRGTRDRGNGDSYVMIIQQ